MTVGTPNWMLIALAEQGQKEVAGAGANPRILEYHAATSLKATSDEVPWCSAFVNWVMAKAGIPGTNSAAARSWLNWGLPVEPAGAPKLGAIVVLERDGPPTAGHVGFLFGEKPGKVVLLGGNQHDEVCLSEYPKSRVLGYRWPVG